MMHTSSTRWSSTGITLSKESGYILHHSESVIEAINLNAKYVAISSQMSRFILDGVKFYGPYGIDHPKIL